MLTYIDAIRKISKQLLAEETVEMIIGFRKGTAPMMNEPFLAKTSQDADQLVWDSNCGINLANYLTDRKEKIGIVAKGCDCRNIITHIIENKIQREQLFVIGVPCKGMIDKRAVAGMFDNEITEVREAADTVIVKGVGFDAILEKKEVLQKNCAVCIHRNPVLYDELAANPVEEHRDGDRYADVRRIEALPPEEKWKYFDDLFSPCIRCYACRNACPLCYCPTCFVDESRPQWVGKSGDPIDTRTFHLLRAYHCAGRCTDCGACERACPMGIKLRTLTQELEKECLDRFDWEAGLSLDTRPLLDRYKPDDPDDFIK